MEVDVLGLFPEALKNEEFLVYYQPKVSLRNYRLAGAEALVRWKHGDSFIFPDQFIPTLEKDGAICELDFYMLDHVCANMRHWLDQGRRLFKVSVNLSRAHLRDEKLVERIIQTIDNHNVPHEYIEIELTETTTDVGFAELRKVMANSGSGISRISDTSFNLAKAGSYQVMFHVTAVQIKKLGVTLNGTMQDYTISGRPSGASEIVGMTIVTTTQDDTVLTLRYPEDEEAISDVQPTDNPYLDITSHLVIIQLR